MVIMQSALEAGSGLPTEHITCACSKDILTRKET